MVTLGLLMDGLPGPSVRCAEVPASDQPYRAAAATASAKLNLGRCALDNPALIYEGPGNGSDPVRHGPPPCSGTNRYWTPSPPFSHTSPSVCNQRNCHICFFVRTTFRGWISGGGGAICWHGVATSTRRTSGGSKRNGGTHAGRVPPIAAASWPDYFTTGYPAFSQPAT